jgi:hypothetical protein
VLHSILWKLNVRVWIGFIWLRIGTSAAGDHEHGTLGKAVLHMNQFKLKNQNIFQVLPGSGGCQTFHFVVSWPRDLYIWCSLTFYKLS